MIKVMILFNFSVFLSWYQLEVLLLSATHQGVNMNTCSFPPLCDRRSNTSTMIVQEDFIRCVTLGSLSDMSPVSSLLYPETRSRPDKDLQLSDLDDFDTLESESSECELKHRYHMNTHMTTTGDLPGDHLIKDTSLKISIPVSLGGEQDLGKSCLKTSPEDFQADSRQQVKACYNQQQAQQQGHQILDGKPRIWSLAQTATSLNQTEYPSCMLRCQPPPPPPSSSLSPSPAATSPVTGLDNRQDSPVTTLRNWVDGVFHDPLFRHSTLSQALTNTTVSWTANTKGALLEAERSSAALQQHHDSSKDSGMAFPKSLNKLFCS